jgi:UDP-N-acetyl-2-amino-2-deoxyglucuronate dehydrogenase
MVPERFFREGLANVDILIVCTPNCYHVTHTLQGLKAGCTIILEKPLACKGLGLQSAASLLHHARSFKKRVYPVIQLRYHPEIVKLREKVRSTKEFYHCEIDYATYRGDWYKKSWKGDERRSGGLLVNLGVHLFDLCCFVFGPFMHPIKAKIGQTHAHGSFRCERATVEWRLSTDDMETRRVFKVAGQEIDDSNRMGELHRRVYEEVLRGRGFDLDDAAQALHAIDSVKERAALQHV